MIINSAPYMIGPTAGEPELGTVKFPIRADYTVILTQYDSATKTYTTAKHSGSYNSTYSNVPLGSLVCVRTSGSAYSITGMSECGGVLRGWSGYSSSYTCSASSVGSGAMVAAILTESEGKISVS